MLDFSINTDLVIILPTIGTLSVVVVNRGKHRDGKIFAEKNDRSESVWPRKSPRPQRRQLFDDQPGLKLERPPLSNFLEKKFFNFSILIY